MTVILIRRPQVAWANPRPADFEAAKAELAIAYQRIHELTVELLELREALATKPSFHA